MNEDTLQKLKDKLLFKRIKGIENSALEMTDGTRVYFQCTAQDCCAYAEGSWDTTTLDAMVTDIKLESYGEDEYDYNEPCEKAKLTIYHNLNNVAQADLYADSGNGGYYYSVLSVFVSGENIGEILSCG